MLVFGSGIAMPLVVFGLGCLIRGRRSWCSAWVYLLPIFLVGLGILYAHMAAAASFAQTGQKGREYELAMVTQGPIAAIAAGGVFATIGMLISICSIPKPLLGGCLQCGYDLRGIDSGRCPECGAAIPLDSTREKHLTLGPLFQFKHLAAVILFIFLSIATYLYYVDFVDERLQPFSPGTWKSGSRAVRGSMASSLAQSGFLVGKTSSEIITLLGNPSLDTLNYTVGEKYLSVNLRGDVFTKLFLLGERNAGAGKDTVFSCDNWKLTPPRDRFLLGKHLLGNPTIMTGYSRDKVINCLGSPDVSELLEYELENSSRKLIIHCENGIAWSSNVLHL